MTELTEAVSERNLVTDLPHRMPNPERLERLWLRALPNGAPVTRDNWALLHLLKKETIS